MDNWAVVKTGGKQYFVSVGQTIEVEKQETDKEQVIFDQVLAVKTNGKTQFGTPIVDKAKISAKIIQNFKAKKIRVVKFKSKSRYLRTYGHRQNLTRVKIEKIQA